MTELEEFEVSFEFDEDDPRKDDPELNTLRVSCMLCYDMREKHLLKIEELEDRTTWVENPISKVRLAFSTALSSIAVWLQKYPLLVIVIICASLAFSLTGGLLRSYHLMLNRNVIVNILLMLLLSFGVLLVLGLFKSIGTLKLYREEMRERMATYEDDLKNIALAQASIEIAETQLNKMIKDGGLSEPYWNFGREIWSYVKDHRADSVKEALRCLDNDIFDAKMELATKSNQ